MVQTMLQFICGYHDIDLRDATGLGHGRLMSSIMRSTAGIAVTAVAGHLAAMHVVPAYPPLRGWPQHPGRLSLPCAGPEMRVTAVRGVSMP